MSTINIRSKRIQQKTELRVLIAYDTQPTQFIRLLTITCNQKLVLSAELTENTAKNPFFNFKLKQTQAGDKIVVNWLDNQGHIDSAQHVIQ